MKKFFLFSAAIIAALTVNAKVLDLTAVGTTIGEWTINEATLNADNSDADKGKFVYDIAAGVPSESFVTAEPNVVFQLKNGSDKAKAFVVYPGKCYEFGGKNGILILKNTQPGDKIVLTAAAKGSSEANFAGDGFPVNAAAVSADLVLPAKNKDKAETEGYDKEGYLWKEIEFVSLGGEVQIKEFAGGYRISKIQVGAGQGVDNVNADVKAVKTFENGQLVIIKNGVRYNALGAQL